MAIQAPTGQITQLCNKLVENPQEIANSYNFTGYLYRVAAIVSAVAMVAIFTGSTALYLGLIPTLPVWAVAVGIIAAFACLKGMNLWSSGTAEFAKAQEYQLIADVLSKDNAEGGVADWGAGDVGLFFQEMNLLPHHFAPAAIDAMNQQVQSEDQGLLSLLPLIARYKVYSEQLVKERESYEENIQLANEHSLPGHEELEKRHRFTAMKVAEKIAFLELNRAIILENLRFPDRDYEFGITELGRHLDGDRVERIQLNALKVNGIDQGFIIQKEIETRALDYIADRRRDAFISRYQVSTSIEDFIDCEPHQLRGRIFDPPEPDLNDQAQ